MSYTPGPWEVKYSGAGYVSRCMIANGVDEIASMNPFRKTFNEDAHLIAAAPDLLEALERLVALQNEREPFTDAGMWEYKLRRREVEDMARAAIKKARGEA